VLVAGQGAALDYSAEISEKLKQQGTRLPAERLIAYIHTFSETIRELRFAPHMRTALEVCALKLCSPIMLAENNAPGYAHTSELEGLLSRLAKLEHQVSSLAEMPQSIPPEEPAKGEPHTPNIPPSLTPTPPETSQPAPPAHAGGLTPQLLSTIKSNWKAMTNTLSPMLRSTLIRCGLEADGAILQIVCDNESEVKFLKEKNRPLAIREALAEKFNLSTPPNLAFIVRDTYNKATSSSNGPIPITPQSTPEPAPQAKQEPQMEQMDWSDFGQGVDADADSPF